MAKLTTIVPAVLIACSMNAQAVVTITIQEVGDDVVVTGSGTFLPSSSNFDLDINSSLDILNPSNFTIQAGSNTDSMVFSVTQSLIPTNPPVFPPPSYGAGPELQQPTTNSGDPFRISFESDGAFIVFGTAADYIPESNLSFRSTYANETLASLGIELGTIQWGWTEDYVVLNVIPRAIVPASPTSVPTLGTFGLMGLAGAIGAAGVAMTRRRKK